MKAVAITRAHSIYMNSQQGAKWDKTVCVCTRTLRPLKAKGKNAGGRGRSCNVMSNSFNLVLLPAVSVLSFSTSKLLLICRLWWERDLPSKPRCAHLRQICLPQGKKLIKKTYGVRCSFQFLSWSLRQYGLAFKSLCAVLAFKCSCPYASVYMRRDKVCARIVFIMRMCMRRV